MKYVELSFDKFSKIKEVSLVEHVKDIGIESSLYFRLLNRKLKSNQFITNLDRSVFYKSCSTDIDSCFDDLYKYEYDVITVMENQLDYVNSIINDIKVKRLK